MKLGRISFITLILYTLEVGSDEDMPPPCDSEIYCYGKLLETVQLANIFPDSKTFVDMDMKKDPETILENFDRMYTYYGGNVPVKEIKQFLEQHFEFCHEAGRCPTLESWVPEDWKPSPSILNRIVDPDYRKWASFLNEMWKKLSRKMNRMSLTFGNYTSLIYVPNGYITPGGRFGEIYYWDTYWIVKGLLICEMKDTAKGVIENLLYLVKKFGHVPNGNRVYYARRTQPPMLIMMSDTYVKFTNDWEFINENIEVFETEMDYFLKEKRIVVEKKTKKFEMFRYYVPADGPRPEAFRHLKGEDYNGAQKKPTSAKKSKFWVNVKATAESGWIFSSRFIIINGTNQGTLENIATTDIIPVDLNAFLHKSFSLLAEWNTKLARPAKANYYKKLSNDLLDAIEAILWNDEDGIWYDFDTVNNKPRDYFYLSNFAPLWTGSFRKTRAAVSSRILQYLNSNHIFKYLGGIPASFEHTNEQWDFPNSWPPLQSILILGLDGGNFETMLAAYNLAKRWVNANYHGYKAFGKMFEKYSATEVGRKGGGGEYTNQEGFGWTNGVILEFLDRWGNVLVNTEGNEWPLVIRK